MVASIELFANQTAPTAILQLALPIGQDFCVVSNTQNFPQIMSGSGQQFRIAIQDTSTSPIELLLVTATVGNNFTVTRGIEGSTPSAHIAGAGIAQIITQDVFGNVFPQVPRVAIASPVTIVKGDNAVEINLATPGIAAVSVDPTTLIPGKKYTVKDKAGNAGTYAIIITPASGMIDGGNNFQITENFGSVTFESDGINLLIVSIVNPPASTFSQISREILVDPRDYGARCTGWYGINSCAIGAAGTNFVIGDKFLVADLALEAHCRGAQLAEGEVLSVNGGGGITGFSLLKIGSGYYPGGVWVQPLTGAGIGASLNINSVFTGPGAPSTNLQSGGISTELGLGGSYNAGGVYAVGDTFAIPNPSLNGNYATGRVDSVSDIGQVVTYHLNNPGGDYEVASAVECKTLTGFGIGLSLNITDNTSAGNTFDDTHGYIAASLAAVAAGGSTLWVDNSWVANLMLPSGTSLLGQGLGPNYSYETANGPNFIFPSTGPHMFIIGVPNFGIDFNAAENICLTGGQVRAYEGDCYQSTAAIGSFIGAGGGAKCWLYKVSARGCKTGLGSPDGTGGFMFLVSELSDWCANQYGIFGPLSDFLTIGDTFCSCGTGMRLPASAGGLARIISPRFEYSYNGIELDSGGLQTDIVGAQFDRISERGIYIVNSQQVKITGGSVKACGFGGTLTVTGAANNGSGLIRLTVNGYGDNPNGGDTPTSYLVTGDVINISGVIGTLEANGNQQTITVVDGTHIDLQGSAYVNAYISGGYGNVNGKGSYLIVANSTDIHCSNVAFEGYSGGTYIPIASVIDAVNSTNISFFGGIANKDTGANTGTYLQAFANWHNATNTPPAGVTIAVTNNPLFSNDIFAPTGRIVATGTSTALLETDNTLEINVAVPFAVNINPAILIPFKRYTIIDVSGNAGTDNITLTPSSGTINGQATFVLINARQSVTFYSNGTNLRIVA